MTAYLPKEHASTEDKKRITNLIFCQKRTAVVLGNAITSVSVTMHKYFRIVERIECGQRHFVSAIHFSAECWREHVVYELCQRDNILGIR